MNRILIDTNILIYLFNDTLDDNVEALVRDWENQVYVSSVSVMEFIHLLQNNRIAPKYKMKIDIIPFIEDTLGFRILYTTREHLLTLEKLPYIDGHNDPNDRLIISQAIADRIELISSDTKFTNYCKWGLKFIKAKHQS